MKLKQLILGVLAVAGAWCAEAADAVTYLEPVFGKKYGETTGFEEKTVTDYTLHENYDTGSETWKAGWHVVSGGVKVDVALHMDGDVKIILKDGATLTVNKSNNNNGGLRVEGDNSLTVYAQSTAMHSIGKIEANGGENGSAIGSRGDTKHPHHSGYITINGGVIEANGGNAAAGIGGGRNGVGRCITINGGTVTATGGEKSAGIGGGDDAEGFNITINGGTVTATGGFGGAGIGGGFDHDGHDITINGGTVTATGGFGGAGIGGGKGDGNAVKCHVIGYNIFIHDGAVTAKGGGCAAGIGGGFAESTCGNADGHNIWITGGTVTATATTGAVRHGSGKLKAYCGAGIGGGGSNNSGVGHNIHITGGKVTAKSDLGAGIGGDVYEIGHDIYIAGGTVIATSGKGDAIGGGTSGSYNIQFDGGSIKQNGTIYANPVNAAGAKVYKATVTGLTESPDTITGIPNYGGNDIYPDNGNAYLYLPEGACSFRSVTKKYSGDVKTDGSGTFNPQGGATCGVMVDSVDVSAGSGAGWTYADKVLTLSQAKGYALSGTNLAGLVRVKVTANADVTLYGLQLASPKTDNVIEIAAGTADAKLTLVGDCPLTAYDAAVGVASGAKVTLAGSGALVGGKDSGVDCRGVNVATGGTFVMDGGTIRGYAYTKGGGAVCNNGTMTMSGGTISGCQAGWGGGVSNYGTMSMTGGTIDGNKATSADGGGIINYSTLYVYGGTVRNNHTVGYGGAISNARGCYAYVYGGAFIGNGADKGCGFLDGYATEHTGCLYGGVWDKDPTKADDTALMYGAKVAQVGGVYVVGRDPATYNGWLAGGTYTFDPTKAEYEAAGLKLVPGSVAVPQGTTPEKYVLNQGATGVTVNGASIAAGSGTGWTFANNVLTLSSAMDYLVKGLSESPIFIGVTADAHVTLKDFGSVWDSPSQDVVIISAQNATLTLEGANQIYTKNGHAAIGIAQGAKLTLDGSGDLVGGKAENASTFCVWVEPSGTFVMNGGTIRNYYTTSTGAAVHLRSSTMTMNGGTISGCMAVGKGGAIHNDGGTFTMNGGTISGCKTDLWGGAVYNDGTMTIMGGAIEDSYATRYGGAIANGSGHYTYIYGGTFKGNNAGVASPFLDSNGMEVTGYLYGGVWTGKNPMDDYGMALQNGATVTQVGDNYIVGKGVKQDADAQLTGGTYTFDPTKAEYEAANVALAPFHVAEPKDGSPATWKVSLVPTGFTVNGTDLNALSGTGWTYDNASRLLTLNSAPIYTLAGDGSAFGFGVSVDNGSATVVLSNATIAATERAPLTANSKGVTVELAGENTLTALGETAALAVPSGASVTIYKSDGQATSNACLTAIGGNVTPAIGGEGDVTVEGGTVVAQGGIVGANIMISGGSTAAVGASGLSGIGDNDANVTISGGTVVAQGDGVADIDGNVNITGGSVQANLVTNPRNADDVAVFRVTVPDVTNVTQGASISGITGAEEWFADNYGQKEIYPLDGALYLWMPNGYYEKFYVGEDKQPYCAKVSDEPTVAYRLNLDLYVNGEQVTEKGGTGWRYDRDERHLTLSPDEGSTNRYVITGTATDGAVSSIIVEGSCDVTAADLLLGVVGEDPLEENLLQIGNGEDECTVNLTITGASAFMVATRGEIAPLGVKANATLNFRGSATIRKWDINVEDGGRVTMEDPKTLTFTSEEDAEAASAIIKPAANTSDFPDIDQEAYAALFDVSVVPGEIEGTWTLDYQLTDETIQKIQASFADAERELAQNLADDNPSTTIADSIPGLYYALASAPCESALAGATSGWTASQDEETAVAGATYAGTAMAYYQLRATWRPVDAEEVKGTVMVPPDVGVTVDGTDVKNGEGEGWTFSCGFLTLTNAQKYVIAGTNTACAVRVFVTANADVTLDHAKLVNASSADVVTFEAGAADATLTLVGENTVYSKDNKAAVCIGSGAKVSLAGTGALVGGKSAGVGSRGVFICADATFVMDGGTISGYCTTDWGGAVYNKNGTAAIYGGTITDCQSRSGGAIYHKNGKVTIYGGRFSGNTATVGNLYDGSSGSLFGGVFGGVFAADPTADAESKGRLVLQGGAAVTQVGANYVVGKDVDQNADAQLTAGTYTFCPTNAEYVAAGLVVEDGVPVTKMATTPVTWVLGVVLTYPDYLAGKSHAVTNTFDIWANTYGSRDPDGVYTNAFLLNVATNREAAAVAAFKIESLVVTNDVADITVAKPIDGASAYNGKVWLQCVTNDLSKADWLDIEDGRYTEGDKSFFTMRIDFEHTVTPEAFPTEPTGSKTVRLIVK